jgi:hypothetical protein
MTPQSHGEPATDNISAGALAVGIACGLGAFGVGLIALHATWLLP